MSEVEKEAEKEKMATELAKTMLENRKENLNSRMLTLKDELDDLEQVDPAEIAKQTLERLKKEEEARLKEV